jgi:hypothetical protein
MAFDNFTPTKVRAIKECPEGQALGEVFVVTADVADILIQIGSVERVSDDTPVGRPVAVRGPYNRRDLRAKP